MLICWITDDLTATTVVDYGISPGKYSASETGYSTTYQLRSYTSGSIHNGTAGAGHDVLLPVRRHAGAERPV
jgi:acid phosphatase type 7